MRKLYLNTLLRYSHAKNFIVAVFPDGKTIPLLDIHMRLLQFVQKDFHYDNICNYIHTLDENLNADKVIECLLKERILLEKPLPYRWNSMSFGKSLVDENEINAIVSVLKSKKYFQYDNLTLDGYYYQPNSFGNLFESAVKKILNCQFFLTTNSGTSALDAILEGYGFSHGDEIIIPCFCYIGVPSVLIKRGIKPILCDVDSELMLSPDKVVQLITKKTKAIICMHYKGRAAKIIQLAEIAQSYSLKLIEDCAQSFGTIINGKALGTFGDASYFSFHPHKLITCGEGGGICTNNPRLYERLQLIIDASRLFAHQKMLPGIPGNNYRMSEIHAALGYIQLFRLQDIIKYLMNLYNAVIADIGEIRNIRIVPVEKNLYGGIQSVCLQVEDDICRKELLNYLHSLGVQAATLYDPQGLHHDIFLNWPYVMEKLQLTIKWKPHDVSLMNLYKESLTILQKTITIPLGINVSQQEAEALSADIKKFLVSYFPVNNTHTKEG
ncbi:MAG: hypothetical protein HFE30_01070 [Clostridiales bacterium]|nr:hypothetical protein [Clostridiales bacterium]